jgi:hypothetical protein
MRSSSEAEPSNSLEHAMLDAVEAGHSVSGELGARMELLLESEKNMRNGLFPELYPRRFRNMEQLFDLFRSSRSLPEQTLWQEARLLRLMERYEQCRQLCQSQPMYEWSFHALQEFIWAGRRDNFPYLRFCEFESESDIALAEQHLAAATTMHQAKCYQWHQAREAESKPTKYERRLVWRNAFLNIRVLLPSAIVGYMGGWLYALPALAVIVWIDFDPASEREALVEARMEEWLRDNPRPKMHLKLTHKRAPIVRGGAADIS